jgi:hypothetical protein
MSVTCTGRSVSNVQEDTVLCSCAACLLITAVGVARLKAEEERHDIITSVQVAKKMGHRINTRADNFIFIVEIKRGVLYFTGLAQDLSYSALRLRSGC